MRIRRAALALGLALVGLAAFFAIPYNGVLETARHRVAGTVLAHLAVLVALWGAAPILRRRVASLDALAAGTLGSMLAVAVVAPLVIVSVLRVAAPYATHQILTREWGLVEPLQVALYVTALALCRAIAASLAAGDGARVLYRAGGVALVIAILEEVDWLGLVSLVAQAMGAPGGRVGRKHIGGLHDLVDALSQSIGIPAFVAAVVAGAVLLTAWGLFGRHGVAVRRELLRRSALPLAVFALGVIGAQAIDIDDRRVRALLAIGLLEESLELAAGVALNAALLLRLREARLAGAPQ